jgi:hypothetical protein
MRRAALCLLGACAVAHDLDCAGRCVLADPAISRDHGITSISRRPPSQRGADRVQCESNDETLDRSLLDPVGVFLRAVPRGGAPSYAPGSASSTGKATAISRSARGM